MLLTDVMCSTSSGHPAAQWYSVKVGNIYGVADGSEYIYRGYIHAISVFVRQKQMTLFTGIVKIFTGIVKIPKQRL